MALALVLFALTVGWGDTGKPAPTGPSSKAERTAPAAEAGASGASAPAGAWALLAAAESAASGDVRAPDAGQPTLRDADWRAMDRQWCQAAQPLRDRLARGEPLGQDALRTDWIDHDERRSMEALLARHVGRALLAHADPRAQAVGHWWMGVAVGEPNPEALMALAQSSRQPLAAALAARDKNSTAVARRATRLWLDLEPDNLVPHLQAQGTDPIPVDDWLARLVQTRRSDAHLGEAFRWVFSAAPASAGVTGEQLLMGMALGIRAAEVSRGQRALGQACLKPGSAKRADLCAQVTERLWSLPADNVMTMVLLLAIEQNQPAPRPAWAARAERLAATLQLASDLGAPELSDQIQRTACLPGQQDLGPARLQQSEWAYLQAKLPTDPAALAALAAKNRARP